MSSLGGDDDDDDAMDSFLILPLLPICFFLPVSFLPLSLLPVPFFGDGGDRRMGTGTGGLGLLPFIACTKVGV